MGCGQLVVDDRRSAATKDPGNVARYIWVTNLENSVSALVSEAETPSSELGKLGIHVRGQVTLMTHSFDL